MSKDKLDKAFDDLGQHMSSTVDTMSSAMDGVSEKMDAVAAAMEKEFDRNGFPKRSHEADDASTRVEEEATIRQQQKYAEQKREEQRQRDAQREEPQTPTQELYSWIERRRARREESRVRKQDMNFTVKVTKEKAMKNPVSNYLINVEFVMPHFVLRYSADGKTWKMPTDATGNFMVFSSIEDAETWVKVAGLSAARQVKRIYPKAWHIFATHPHHVDKIEGLEQGYVVTRTEVKTPINVPVWRPAATTESSARPATH